MAHLTLLESTVGFVLLIAGIYAFLWGLWFLGVRFVPAWPFLSLVRQRERDHSKDGGNSSPLLNEYLKRRRHTQASGRCPSCGKALVVRIDNKGKFSRPAAIKTVPIFIVSSPGLVKNIYGAPTLAKTDLLVATPTSSPSKSILLNALIAVIALGAKIRLRDFRSKFARGYRRDEGKRFWGCPPPDIASKSTKLDAMQSTISDQTNNKQTSLRELN